MVEKVKRVTLSMIIKTINGFKESRGENNKLMRLFKNSEDEEFPGMLFRKTLSKEEEQRELIANFKKNWDLERIAFIYIIVMQMAICEILEFSSIPIKVTFNEYIEIVKFYSTNNSSVFINGILDKVIKNLKEENKIKKTGRGLMEK